MNSDMIYIVPRYVLNHVDSAHRLLKGHKPPWTVAWLLSSPGIYLELHSKDTCSNWPVTWWPSSPWICLKPCSKDTHPPWTEALVNYQVPGYVWNHGQSQCIQPKLAVGRHLIDPVNHRAFGKTAAQVSALWLCASWPHTRLPHSSVDVCIFDLIL